MAAAAKLRLEALLGKKLPFDDQVLEYLLRVAPASDTMELLELVEDFCPKWPKHERASLAAKLKSEAQGEGNGQLGQDSSSHVPASSSSSSAKPAAEGEDRGGRSAWGGGQQRVGGGAGPTQTGDGQSSSGPTAASAELLAADMLLAQMLQEEEDAQATIGHQPQPGNKKGGKKPSYKPMNISYNLSRGGAAGASFGTGLPSSLADVLRNRRSQDAQAVGFLSEHFGPPAAREGAASKWAPAADLQGMTWAERAQQASAQVAEEEAAIASMEARADKAVAKVAPSGPVAAGAMRVRIRTVEGVEYLVDANPSETVGDVKSRLEKAQGIPFVQQRLIHLGRELLQDSLELKAVGFRDGQCNLQLALRSAGELPPATRQQPPQPSRQVLGDIRLELPGGKSASLSSLPWDVTGAMLKQRIEVQHGIRLEHMELSFFGMRLEDDLALREQGVASGALISVEIAPPTYSASGEYFPKVGVGVADKQLLGKMSRKQQQDQMAGLQTSEFGRVMDENEALRLAMAASMAGPGSVAAFGRALDDDEGEAEDPGQDQAEACDMDKVEFLGDVAAQEKSMANSVSQAKSLATSLAYKDVISRVSKRSGYRLTLITDKTKKARPVLGYAVCRFPPKGQRTLNVLQVGISEQHRGLGLGRQMVRWLVQYAKKAATAIDVIAVSCPSGGTSFYEKLGFRASASQGLDGEDQMDGHVCLEYKFQTKASVAASKGAKKGKQEPMARPELLKLVFEACDADADGFLNQQEMGHFAVQTGFDGGDDAWAQEFATLCGDNGITGARGGVNASLFAKLVDDESDQGIYCTDAELSSMLAILAPPKPASVSSKTKKFDSRSEVVREVFKRLDTNGAGFLRSQEMLPFANHTGFDGSDADWAEEFQSLCSEPGSAQGVGVEHFARLVDDESDNGCYCTDEELRDLMAKLRPVAPVPASPAAQHSNGAPSFAKDSDSRSEVVREVFKRLDTNRAGFLSAQDMLPFANHTGFDGSDADWAEEFQSLCSEPGSSQGVGVEHFARLVDDESDDGCYCSDEELRDLLAKLPEQEFLEVAQPLAEALGSGVQPLAFQGDLPLPPAVARSRPPPGLPPPPPGLDPPQRPPPGIGEGGEGGQFFQDQGGFNSFQDVPSPSGKEEGGRSELLRSVFELCDRDRDGRLSAREMYIFAAETGFQGSFSSEWEEEFVLLCTEKGVDPQQGISLEAFSLIANDEADFCTDEELGSVMSALQLQAVPLEEAGGSAPSSSRAPRPSGTVAPASRSTMVSGVFRALDADGDGHLNMSEMKVFAVRVGFDGGDADWAAEFASLCAEHGSSVSPLGSAAGLGIDAALFARLVDDESDNGCYSSDAELRALLRDLLPAVRAASAPSLASGSSSAASSAEGPAGRGLQLLAQPTTQRPYRVVVDFHNVLDIGPPEGAIPFSLAPAFRSLQAEFPRLEFEVLSFCTTRDRRNEVHRRCNQFEQLVSGGGPRRPIFAAVATCDERTGKPQWKHGAWGSGGKDFHCCFHRCDALIDDHPSTCFAAYQVGVNVFPIQTRREAHRGNTSYRNVFLALEAWGQQLRSDPNRQSSLLHPDQVR
ncbi:unnamed protein product [Polarella glacialis]|uniref:Calmodulin n=1 Tax=Polarella glacialis TaxID=89957 RepID=A0A813JG68_POLGL|nr:unnamed protein product [Polarella glacialis]